MSKELRSELAGFKSDLDAAEGERKKDDQAEVKQRSVDIENLLSDFETAHQKMADNLRSELAGFKSDLDAAEGERKKTDQAEIRETAAAWKGLLSAMQAARGHAVVAGPVEVEAAVEVKTVEEVVEEPEEAAEEPAEETEPEIEDEDLGGRILDLIEDNPEGLKMTQIGDMLGIANWRVLIPVMGEFLEGGEIRKEGTLYFPPQ